MQRERLCLTPNLQAPVYVVLQSRAPVLMMEAVRRVVFVGEVQLTFRNHRRAQLPVFTNSEGLLFIYFFV